MDDIVRCSFCNKTQAQVKKLIAGPNGTYICDECVAICSEIIEEEVDYSDDRAFDDINLLTPEEMKDLLDDYVIGQDEAKKCFRWQSTIITKELWLSRISAWNSRRVIFLCSDLPDAARRSLPRRLQKS